MRGIALIALLLAAGCGGSEPLAVMELLGKPCSSTSECAPLAGVVCAPVLLDPPGPEYACEMPLPNADLRSSTGGCPEGTKVWVALLRLPNPLPSGRYQTADYCAPVCQMTNEPAGTCRWGRQCIGVCTR